MKVGLVLTPEESLNNLVFIPPEVRVWEEISQIMFKGVFSIFGEHFTLTIYAIHTP